LAALTSKSTNTTNAAVGLALLKQGAAQWAKYEADNASQKSTGVNGASNSQTSDGQTNSASGAGSSTSSSSIQTYQAGSIVSETA
jgi:hypothetical protein